VLRRLYLLRVGFSAIWVTVILILNASPSRDASGDLLVRLALSAYPAADAVASLIDVRATDTPAYRCLLYGNTVAGLVATVAILVLASGLSTEIRTLGIWAIASGAAQLLVGALRQRMLRGQWLMIISGAGSVFAGATFAGLLGSSASDLPALAQYSVGGAVWYVVTAVFLVAAARVSTPRPVTGVRDA
jgi:hypothetical protein